MDRSQVRAAFLKLMIAVLTGTTWVFWSFIFSTRPEQPDPDTFTALVRLPASLPAGLSNAVPIFSSPIKPEPIRMDVVNLECWDKTDIQPVQTGSRWLRLNGRNCQTDASADTVDVRNLSNGYSATVFPQQGRMTTDFIPLVEGENEIQIRFDQGAGVAFENLVKVRRQ